MKLNLQDNALRFHTTPADIESQQVIGRMYGDYNIRGPFFYPKSPNGMGDWADYVAALGLEDCGQQTTVGGQYACSQRNTAKEAAGNPNAGVTSPTVIAEYSSDPAIAAAARAAADEGNWNFMAGQTVPQGGTPPAGTPPPVYNPRVVFTTSRGGTTAQPGDTWTVSISGAAPNTGVSVTAIHPDGGSATQSFGNTDGSGNWSLSGTFDSSMLGTWSETWKVGSQTAGSFRFTVQANSGSGSGGTGGGASSGSGGATGGGTQSGAGLLGGIPTNTLVLIAAGLGAVLFLGGKR